MSAYETSVTPARTLPPLDTRQPTGRPSWPLILVEGPEKSGKSWLMAEFTKSDRFSRCLWLDWMEPTGDEYFAIEGTRFEMLDHDGRFETICYKVWAAKQWAQAALDAGEKPYLLLIDSMTAEWDHLKAWADAKAVRTPSAQKKLERDPGAEISVPMNIWNEVHDRHYKLMRQLMTFPGVVVVTARGKDVAALDKDGRPTGERSYKVEGHKNLAYDVDAVIRLSRDSDPLVVGARSVHAGIRPGHDKARRVPGLELEWLTWGVLLKGLDAPQVRQLNAAPVDDPAPQPSPQPAPEPVPAGTPRPADVDWQAALEEAGDDHDKLTDLWHAAKYGNAPAEVMAKIEAAGRAAKGEPAKAGDQ